MVKRGCSNLYLSALHNFFIFWNNSSEQLFLLCHNHLLVGLGKFSAFSFQSQKQRVFFNGKRIKPGEVKPYLKVKIVLHGKSQSNLRKLFLRNIITAFLQEFKIPRVRLYHIIPVSHKAI